MCDVADEAIVAANIAFGDTDLAEAERAVELSGWLTRMQEQAEANVMSLLALQAPVGRDLRQAVTSIHLVGDLVRMGQLAQHIAKVVLRRYPNRTGGAARATLAQMGVLAHELTEATRETLVSHAPESADWIGARDNAMDALAANVFEVLMDGATGVSIPDAVDAVLLSRFYERYGDHAVAVARRIAFQATGRHSEPALNHPKFRAAPLWGSVVLRMTL